MQEARKQTGVKYSQFSLVGASNTLVDVGAFNLLLWSAHSPGLLLVYNVAALILANANSYLWNTLWTFRDEARHDAKQVGMFTAQGLLNVGVGNALLWLVAHGLQAHTDPSTLLGGNVAKAVSKVVASTLSFLFHGAPNRLQRSLTAPRVARYKPVRTPSGMAPTLRPLHPGTSLLGRARVEHGEWSRVSDARHLTEVGTDRVRQKTYQRRPVRQLELLVEPKLAYTYTSTRGCAALAAAQTGTLVPAADVGLDSE